MIVFNNIYQEFYIILIVLSVLFLFISKIPNHYLTVIIIIMMLSYVAYIYMYNVSQKKENSEDYKQNTLDKDISHRDESNESTFFIRKFPKNLKYLKHNDKLIEIITNIRFVKKFSKTRYSDILLNLNSLMKIYIYVLSGRYNAVDYIHLFVDIRDNIIELMNSLIIVVPKTMKHVYGLNAYDEIYKSIDGFVLESRNMLIILERYATIHLGELFIPDNKYKPYNALTQTSFP